MRRQLVATTVAAIGIAGMAVGTLAIAEDDPGATEHLAFAPELRKAPPPPPPPTATPTPTQSPRPDPYIGPIASIYLGSAGLNGYSALETGGTYLVGERETLEDPTHPSLIMWYPNLQGFLPPNPGFAGGHTIMAAHVNYVGYGNGPFAYLTDASNGDALYITMANGAEYAYTVRSVEVVSLATLNMDDVVYPGLDANTERITLISCGGTFIPRPGGGGDYDSRVILVAERYVP